MTSRRMPNLFLIGAAKAGTTTLHDCLARHPSLYMATVKETNFFSRDALYERGLDWYRRTHFASPPRTAMWLGESTPHYLCFDKVADRIRRDLGPDPRFVVILRDPVERAYSLYWHHVRYGDETLSFEEALEQEERRALTDRLRTEGSIVFAYTRSGFYYRQLLAWLARFPRRSFHLCLYEDLCEDVAALAAGVFGFLGVDPSVRIDVEGARNPAARPRSGLLARALATYSRAVRRRFGRLAGERVPGKFRDLHRRMMTGVRRVNEAEWSYPPMKEDTRARLRELFAEDVRQLENLMGRDLATWRRGAG